MRSLVLRNDLPPVLVGDNWFAYLTGRLPERALDIVEVNRDPSSETIWLHLPNPTSSNESEKVYVHLAPAKRKILGYLLLDSKGETLAEISYAKQEGKSDLCPPGKT